MKLLAMAMLASYLSVSALQTQDNGRLTYVPSAPELSREVPENQRQKPQAKRVFYQEYDMGATFLDLNGRKRTYLAYYELPKPHRQSPTQRAGMIEGSTEISSFIGIQENIHMRTYVNSEGLPLESITLMRQENNGSRGITDSAMVALLSREGFNQSPGDSVTTLCYEVFTLGKDKSWSSQMILATNPKRLDPVPVQLKSPTYDLLSAMLNILQYPFVGTKTFSISYYHDRRDLNVKITTEEDSDEGVYYHAEADVPEAMIRIISHVELDFVPNEAPFYVGGDLRSLPIFGATAEGMLPHTKLTILNDHKKK